VISPGEAPKLLTTLVEKLKRFEEIGVEEVAVLRFDLNFSELDAVSFVREILLKKLDLGKLIIGYDHCFGKDRSGGIALLRTLSKEFSFDIEVFGVVHYRGEPISSSRIRKAISLGEFDKALEMLGESYLISGEKVAGKGRGRKLGFPTVNMSTADNKLLPPEGVYASRVEVGRRHLGGMTCIGTRPTFGEGEHSLEVHLFDYEGPPQVSGPEENNRQVHIYTQKYVRPNIKFDSPEKLTEQLKKDERNIRNLLEGGLQVSSLKKKL